MAFSFTVNTVPANAAVAMYSFLANLVASGWTQVTASDGTTYPTTLTSGNSGAGGLNNSLAWFVVKQPGAQAREFCIQITSGAPATTYQYRIKYSKSAGFTGGAPSATQVPSATDEVVIYGSGSDAAPGFATLFQGNNGFTFNTASDPALGFWMLANQQGTGTLQTGFMLDVMQSATVPAGDVDPAVTMIENNTGGLVFGNNMASENICRAWMGPSGSPSNDFVRAQQYDYNGNQTFPASTGVNSYTSNDDGLPVVWVQPTVGYKGWSSICTWGSYPRANFDTITVSATRDHIYISGNWLPWNGSIPVP